MATFVYVMHIESTAEKVWLALTGPEFTHKYWDGRRIYSDWIVGSPVTMTRGDGSTDWRGEVLAYERPSRLAYTFRIPSGEAGKREPVTQVLFAIAQFGSVAQLTVSHENFETDSEGFSDMRHNWPVILSALKMFVEHQMVDYAWPV